MFFICHEDNSTMKNTQSIALYHKSVNAVKYLFFASLGTVFLVELALSLSWPLLSDSAFLHYIAYLINEHDFVPYRDIFEVNMPGTYLFHMAIGRVFGYSDSAFHMVDAAWLMATLTVTWFIMKPFGRLVAFAGCLLFGLIYLEGGPHMSLQRDFIAILPIATAILIATRCKPHQSVKIIHFLIGALFAFSALVKPHLAIGLPAIILYNCTQNTNESKSVRNLINLCITGGMFALLGFLSVLAIPFLWLWRIGALESFCNIFSSYVPLYVQMSGDFQFRGTLERIINILRAYKKFGGFDFLVIGSMFGVYIVLTKSMSAAIKKLAILISALAVLYSISVIIGGKLWHYHWMPFGYFTSLCTAMILFSSPLFKNLHSTIILPLLIFMVAVMMTVHPAKVAVQQVFYGQKPASVDERVKEIATYLNEHLSPGDKVQPLDWISGGTHAMLISKAVAATPYITDFQFYHNVSTPYIENLRKKFIEELNDEVPEFLIEVHVKGNVKPKLSGLDTAYKFPELKTFMKQHYRKDYTGDNFDIYRRNNE